MKLETFRKSWMWGAIGALASSAPVAADPPRGIADATASIWDVPLLANAKYVARVGRSKIGEDYIAFEHGGWACAAALSAWATSSPDKDELDSARKTCPGDLGKQLHDAIDDTEGLVVVDGKGKVLATPTAILAATLPIDSPAKAVLAVWASPRRYLTPGSYQPVWLDDEAEGKHPGTATVRPSKGGFDVTAQRVAHGDCKPTKTKPDGTNEGPEETVSTWRVVLHVDAGGKLAEASSSKPTTEQAYCGGMGRRPEGFVAMAAADDGTVAGYLRRALHIEAESVRAFERIARELAEHAAPAELVDGALHAAAQEREHAARCAALLGVEAQIADDALPARTLLELALDNAREGCVSESYGALANAVQARDAATPALRAHFAAIAADELEHAALAHAIAEWLDTRLTPGERAAVRAAHRAALHDTAATLVQPRGETDRVLGLPTAAVACRLLELVAALVPLMARSAA